MNNCKRACWKWCFNFCLNSLNKKSLGISIKNPNNKVLHCLRRKLHTTHRQLVLLKQSFITDLSLEIDLDSIKEIQTQELKYGNRVDIHKMVNEELEEKCYQVICQFEEQQARILKAIKLEHSLLYAEGYAIAPPENMTNKNWIEALTHKSKEERLEHYLFLQHKASLKKEWLAQPQDTSEVVEETDKSFILYDESNPTKWGNYGLSSAMMHSVPLVFDLDFDGSMSHKEIGQAAKQMWLMYCANQSHPDPFHFVFTRCHRKNILYRTAEIRHFLNCHHTIFSTSDKCYTDLYERESLVYLSPYAKHSLVKFDPSKVYVIAAYADPRNRKKFGPAKAKEQGIQCLKFPIDENVRWIQGPKDMALQSVVKILLAVKDKKAWKNAFEDAVRPTSFKHYD